MQKIYSIKYYKGGANVSNLYEKETAMNIAIEEDKTYFRCCNNTCNPREENCNKYYIHKQGVIETAELTRPIPLKFDITKFDKIPTTIIKKGTILYHYTIHGTDSKISKFSKLSRILTLKDFHNNMLQAIFRTSPTGSYFAFSPLHAIKAGYGVQRHFKPWEAKRGTLLSFKVIKDFTILNFSKMQLDDINLKLSLSRKKLAIKLGLFEDNGNKAIQNISVYEKNFIQLIQSYENVDGIVIYAGNDRLRFTNPDRLDQIMDYLSEKINSDDIVPLHIKTKRNIIQVSTPELILPSSFETEKYLDFNNVTSNINEMEKKIFQLCSVNKFYNKIFQTFPQFKDIPNTIFRFSTKFINIPGFKPLKEIEMLKSFTGTYDTSKINLNFMNKLIRYGIYDLFEFLIKKGNLDLNKYELIYIKNNIKFLKKIINLENVEKDKKDNLIKLSYNNCYLNNIIELNKFKLISPDNQIILNDFIWEFNDLNNYTLFVKNVNILNILKKIDDKYNFKFKCFYILNEGKISQIEDINKILSIPKLLGFDIIIDDNSIYHIYNFQNLNQVHMKLSNYPMPNVSSELLNLVDLNFPNKEYDINCLFHLDENLENLIDIIIEAHSICNDFKIEKSFNRY